MAEKQYHEQIKFTKSYLIPYFKKNIDGFEKVKVLEIGCAEAGLMEVLAENNISSVGLELDERRAKIALEKNPNFKIIVGDISDPKLVEKIGQQFDLIIMREVIEHVPQKQEAFDNISKLLKENGFLYMTFPPKYSGFAGHQQVGRSILKFAPYLHLLPKSIIKFLTKILNDFKEMPDFVKHNFSTGITIRKFESLYRSHNLTAVIKEFYLFRPIYRLRFGVPTIKVFGIPFLREFIAFGCECLLKKQKI